MKCTETGCTTRMMECVSWLPDLDEIARREKMEVASLGRSDLEKHVVCSDCAKLHRDVEAVRYYRFDLALIKLRREREKAMAHARREAYKAACDKREALHKKYGTTAVTTLAEALRASRERGLNQVFGR